MTKHSYKTHNMFTLTTTALCMTMLAATPVTAPADTTDIYYIDSKEVKDFNGTQLEGKTIECYTIATPEGKAQRMHIITTKKPTMSMGNSSGMEENIGNATTYILNGKKISRDEFDGIKPKSIKSMSVLRDDASKQKYDASASDMVIVIETN